MSLQTLKPNGLYILLFIRKDPPVQNDFHWGLYMHQHPDNGGMKYHVKNIGGGWITDHGITKGVFKSFLLVGLFRIANVPPGWESVVDNKIRTYDSQLNHINGITCRKWVLWVLAKLQEPDNGYSILKCNDLNALEQELLAFGNANAMSTSHNVQPRPVGASSLCSL